ncbi:MAG: acyltransferase [Sphingomonadales bacterium]|nr:acyltransferase [Sphingomonadales bacterium]
MELRRSTIHSVQLLRAVAAAMVTLFHAHEFLFKRDFTAIFPGEDYFIGFGRAGVHIFFVISGFIMVMTAHSDHDYSARRFIMRRLRRIYPIYWLSAALCYATFWFLAPQPLPVGAGDVLGALLLWPGEAPNIIGAAWTLSFEVYFYLCFGLAMILGLNRGLLLLAAFFIGSIAAGVIVRPQGAVLAQMTNALLLEFLAGAAVGWLAVNNRLPERFGPMLVLISVVLFGAGIAYGYDRLPAIVNWGPASVLLVLGVVSWERRSAANMAVRQIGKLGNSSYALYLNHQAIIFALSITIPVGLSGLPALPIAIAISLVCIVLGELIHRYVENPLLNMLKAKPTLRTAAAA